MTYLEIPAHDINKYIWALLKSEGILNASHYHAPDLDLDIIPIVPVQEVPELANHLGDKAYLIYDVVDTNSTMTGDAWWVRKQEITYAIYGPDISKINEIINCLTKFLKKKDESAGYVQAAVPSSKFWFYEVCVEWSELSQATRDEGGRVPGEINISVHYSLKDE
jgi:hypothetical protein